MGCPLGGHFCGRQNKSGFTHRFPCPDGRRGCGFCVCFGVVCAKVLLFLGGARGARLFYFVRDQAAEGRGGSKKGDSGAAATMSRPVTKGVWSHSRGAESDRLGTPQLRRLPCELSEQSPWWRHNQRFQRDVLFFFAPRPPVARGAPPARNPFRSGARAN